MTPATEIAQEESKPSRLPIYLSALIIPGAGQFAQRRPLAGVLFATGFIACLVAFSVYVVKIIMVFYSLAFDFDAYQTSEVMNIPKMEAVVAFLSAMGVYVIGIFETHRAYRRQCARWARRKWRTSEFMEQHTPDA